MDAPGSSAGLDAGSGRYGAGDMVLDMVLDMALDMVLDMVIKAMTVELGGSNQREVLGCE